MIVKFMLRLKEISKIVARHLSVTFAVICLLGSNLNI